MKLRWLNKALLSLDAQAEYLAKESPKAAAIFVTQVFSCVEQLRDFPQSGRPGRVQETRELVMQNLPYIIPYRIVDDEVQILRVFHAARKWPASFK